jgi:hypothetical protein
MQLLQFFIDQLEFLCPFDTMAFNLRPFVRGPEAHWSWGPEIFLIAEIAGAVRF